MNITKTGWWIIGGIGVAGLGVGGYFLWKKKSIREQISTAI